MDLIIFDCDGTLVDSERLCNLGMQYQLSEYGFDYKAEDLIQKFRGVALSLIIKSIEIEQKTVLPDNFETEYRLKVSKLFDEQLKANEGVIALLESLTIPFCVASSGPVKKIKHALRVTGLAKYFGNNIFSSYDIGSWKPAPDIFLHAAKKMNVDPALCCVIEDSLVGLKAANAAKMKSIYYGPEAEAKEPTADMQVKHMAELIGEFD